MDRIRRFFSIYLAIGLVIFGAAADTAQAQNRRNEREVRDLVRSLNSKVDDFGYSLNYRMRNTSADPAASRQIRDNVKNLQDKINAFENNLDRRRENAQDVNDIIDAGRSIDRFLSDNAQNRKIDTDWRDIRDLIDRLAANYGVSPNWNDGGDQNYPNTPSAPPNNYPAPSSVPFQNNINGTYQLDAGRSDNTADVVADAGVANSDQRQDLEDKILAPEQIAVDVRGKQVTLATSNAQPTTFSADGREKTESQPSGGTYRIRATLTGQVLTVRSLGPDTDYTVIFTSMDGGRTLKVSRRVTTDYLRQTVISESYYTKTDQVARLGIDGNQIPADNGNYSSNDPGDTNNPNSPTVNSGRRGDYIVRNGEIITGVLENDISTKVSQNNDRFRLTVQSPDEYRGAVIEGYISGVGRSGKVTGSSNITFNFERITLRSGQTYDFAGFLQSVKDQNGKEVVVDTEGTAKGKSQTKETAKRGGIGAGIGAVIGAIAGGVKGAAIGAIIGGGAGAGSVALENKGDLQLGKGSLITIQASSPKQ
jgi:hypothetical protein